MISTNKSNCRLSVPEVVGLLDGVVSVVECVVTVAPLDVTPVDSELPIEAESVGRVLLGNVWLPVVKDWETILLPSVELSEDGVVFDPMALEEVLEVRLPVGAKLSIDVERLNVVVLSKIGISVEFDNVELVLGCASRSPGG